MRETGKENPLLGLLDGGVGQADQLKGGQAAAQVALHLHRVTVDAVQTEGIHADDHGALLLSKF